MMTPVEPSQRFRFRVNNEHWRTPGSVEYYYFEGVNQGKSRSEGRVHSRCQMLEETFF